MAPASIVLRLTKQLVAGYDTYGFDSSGNSPEVIDGILNGDYPGGEFYIGGKIVKDMDTERAEGLKAKGVDSRPRPAPSSWRPSARRPFRKKGA